MRNYVIINEVNSLTIQGLAINNLPPITKPMIRTQREEIDGRDGDIVTELGYSAYDKQIEIGLYGNFDIDAIIKYFTGEGTITFSNEEDKYYNFKILDQIDYEKLLKFKTATITFHCQPFKYPVEETPIEGEAITITGSGSNISLSNTVVAPMEMKLKGNTLQNGTPTPDTPIDIQVVSGDNSIVVCGVNVFDEVIENGYINYQTGVNVAGDNYRRSKNFINVNPSTTYYLNMGDAPTGAWCGTIQYDKDKNFLEYKAWSKGTTLTTRSDTEYIRFYLNATSYDKICINVSNTSINGTYYPYTSNTYSIDLAGKNIFNQQDFITAMSTNYREIKIIDEEYFICLGRSQSTNTTYEYNVSCKANTQYTLSFDYTNNGSSIVFLYSDTTTSSNLAPASDTVKHITATTEANKTLVAIRIYCGGWYASGSKLEIANIQLEKGTEATNWQPYTTPIQLLHIPNTDYYDKIDKSTGKNLFHKDNFLALGATVQGYLASANGGVYIECKPNTTYSARRVDNSTSRFSMVFLDELPALNKAFTSFTPNPVNADQTNQDVVISATSTANSKYMFLNFASATIPDTMVVEGSYTSETMPSYEPYGTGWYVKKEIGKVVLDGSESWGAAGEGDTTNGVSMYWGISNAIAVATKDLISDYFQFVPRSSLSSTTINFITGGGGNSIVLNIAQTSLEAQTLAGFKTWLSSHNTIVYYPLATPTYTLIEDSTLISQLEALKPYSYNPVTNITQTNNDAPFELDVSLSYTNTMNVNNVGNIYAKPILTIEGSGTIGIILNDIEVLSVDLGTDEKIAIDVPKLEAYNPDNDVLLNRNVTGDYMKLLINDGDNTIAFSGSVTSATLTNYTRWI